MQINPHMELDGFHADIVFTRGDSQSITIHSQSLDFSDGDKLELTIRYSPKRKEVLLHKSISLAEDPAVFIFRPVDTNDLSFGKYVYDIQWTKSDGTVTTLIKPSVFCLSEEVTY